MPPHFLQSSHHYIRFSILPPCDDELILRKIFQNALQQAFGVVTASMYLDILWVAEDGSGIVVRVGSR